MKRFAVLRNLDLLDWLVLAILGACFVMWLLNSR